MPPQLKPVELVDAIGYVRVSLAREEMISPEIQRAAIADWARRTGRRVIDWVQDLDKTGRNFRRNVMGAIERIEAREAREIVVYRYDRWGRSAVESLANIRRVEVAGGAVQSASEPFDAETAIGKFSRHQALGMAEMQSDIIGENWRSAHRNRLERGLPATSTPRFGYILRGRVPNPGNPKWKVRDLSDPAGERYEPDREGGTAAVLKGEYVAYVNGSGAEKRCQALNAAGILNSRGRKWQHNAYFDTLDSGFAAGLLRVHNPECKGCPNVSACQNRIYLPGAQEPIIDTDLWEAYLRRRAEVARTPIRARTPTYPLTGVVVCGHCHYALVPQVNHGIPGDVYKCGRWHMYRDCPGGTGGFVKRVLAEQAVLGRLAEWAAEIDRAAARTEAREASMPRADRSGLERQLVNVDQALSRLAVRKALDGDLMPAAVYESARDELLAERARCEARLAALAETQARSMVGYGPVLADLLTRWEVYPVARKNALLRQLIRHVTVSRPDGPKTAPAFQVVPVWEDCPYRCCA